MLRRDFVKFPNESFRLRANSPQAYGLIAWWPPIKFPDSNRLEDLSHWFNSGSLGLSTNPAWIKDSKFGWALNYDGVDDEVNAGSEPILDDIGFLTIAAWVFPFTLGGGGFGRIFDKAGSNTPTNGWILFTSSNGTDTYQFQADFDGASNLSVRSATGSVKFEVWTHVAVTWTGAAAAASVNIYINGELSTPNSAISGAGNRVTDAGQVLRLGNSISGNRGFDGYMADARIYNRILSATEIRELL